MKNKKNWSIGLCGAICLSIAGVTYASYASALASDTPKVSTSETGNTSSADILYQSEANTVCTPTPRLCLKNYWLF